jgi:hypothetical protein
MSNRQSPTTFIGQLDFSGTTHAGVKANSLTTAQRDALTPSNGMFIYNTSNARFEKYEAGGWQPTSSGSLPKIAVIVGLAKPIILPMALLITWKSNRLLMLPLPRAGVMYICRRAPTIWQLL